jgi:hypothetical protein
MASDSTSERSEQANPSRRAMFFSMK